MRVLVGVIAEAVTPSRTGIVPPKDELFIQRLSQAVEGDRSPMAKARQGLSQTERFGIGESNGAARPWIAESGIRISAQVSLSPKALTGERACLSLLRRRIRSSSANRFR